MNPYEHTKPEKTPPTCLRKSSWCPTNRWLGVRHGLYGHDEEGIPALARNEIPTIQHVALLYQAQQIL